jgi:hypothetical protein
MWFVEQTTSVPCRMGENWGFSFELDGLPLDRPVAYRSEMHHPPIRQPDGTVMAVSVTRLRIDPGPSCVTGEIWSFMPGYEYELVPGTWTRRIFVDDFELGAVTFQVVDPVELNPAPPDPRMLVLGIRYQTVVRESPGEKDPAEQVCVIGVFAGTPAEEIGLRPGDIITRCQNMPIRSAAELHAVLNANAGRVVDLGVLRGTERIGLRVELWKR